MKFKLETELEIDNDELIKLYNYSVDGELNLTLEELLQFSDENIINFLRETDWFSEEIDWYGIGDFEVTLLRENKTK